MAMMMAMAIHKELVAILGVETVNYPSVTGYFREAKFWLSTQPAPLSEPHPAHDDSDNIIWLALAEQPFASVRQLAGLTHLPRSTVHRRLTQSLLFHLRHLRWVPHVSSPAQKLARVTHLQDLFRVLE
jgi:hypothetical protein